jgi:hypothetical protein
MPVLVMLPFSAKDASDCTSNKNTIVLNDIAVVPKGKKGLLNVQHATFTT